MREETAIGFVRSKYGDIIIESILINADIIFSLLTFATASLRGERCDRPKMLREPPRSMLSSLAVAEKTERGEYDESAAIGLARDISYFNVKEALGL